MRHRNSNVFPWLASILIAPVAIGCSSSGGSSVDTLPWHNASVSTSESDTSCSADRGFTAGSRAATDAAELEFRGQVVRDHLDDLRRIAGHPPLVRALREANELGWQSLKDIQEMDVRWRQTKGVDDPLVRKYLQNPTADFLRQARQRNPNYVELFAMDNAGCIVAESDRTSDFWQGDELKWQECFNGGAGKVYVGDVEYDPSTRSYVVQISVPVRDEHDETIGVMTASVSSKKLE